MTEWGILFLNGRISVKVSHLMLNVKHFSKAYPVIHSYLHKVLTDFRSLYLFTYAVLPYVYVLSVCCAVCMSR